MKSKTRRLALVSTIVLPLATAAAADYTWSGAGTGIWDTTNTNWSSAPAAAWNATNGAANVAVFNTAGLTATVSGTVYANGIKFSAAGTLGSGTINLAGTTPTLTADADATINSVLSGTAAVNVVGLVKQGAGTLTLGGINTHAGSVSILAGTVSYVGTASSGTVSTGTATGQLLVGGATAKAVLNLTGTGSYHFGSTGTANNPRIGGNDGIGDPGVGAVNQTSGTVNMGRSGTYLELGTNKGSTPTSYGSYVLSGGTLNTSTTVGGAFRIGNGGLGVFTQTGGVLNSTRWFAIGASTNDPAFSVGVATFTGGTATVTPSYRTILGSRQNSIGILNLGTQAGGNATFNPGTGLELLNVATALSSVANLNSGTLVLVAPIYRTGTNATSTAAVNLNGATLKANAASVGLITASTLLPVNGFNGGVKVDTQAFTANLAANLLATTGNGIYPAGGILSVPSNGGAGYIGAPVVTVSTTTGTGSGATAIATVAGGAVTGVTLTSPGQGYAEGDQVTFAFAGGGYTEAATAYVHPLTAADLAANGTGSLSKLGSGTLTLAGANTYQGPVAVNNGTLILTGTNANTAFSLGATGTAGKLALGQNLAIESLTTAGLGGSIVGGSATVATLTLNQGSGTATLSALGGTTGNEGNLSLVKNGAATLVLTGTASDLVSTTVSGGTLQLGALATDQLTLENCTLSVTSFTGGATAPIRAFNSLTANAVTVKVFGSLATGVFPLIAYPAGGTIGGAGISGLTLDTSNLPRGTTATLQNDTVGSVVALNVTANSLTWQGNVNQNWDINGAANWTLGGFPDQYQENDAALFNDTVGLGFTDVILTQTVAPTSVTFDNNTKNFTLSGAFGITGTTGLLKTNTGTVTLTNTNTYSGITTVNGGILRLGNGTTNGDVAGPISVGNFGTVEFLVAGTQTHTGPITNAGSLAIAGDGTLTLTGDLAGAGTAITKSGEGTLILTGASTYAGTTTITGGTYQIGDGTLNGGTSGTYAIAADATLRIQRPTSLAPTWSSITGAGTLVLNTAVTGDWGNLALPASFTGTLRMERGRAGTNTGPGLLGGTSLIDIQSGAQLLVWGNATTPLDYPKPIRIAGPGWGEAGYEGGLRMAGGAGTAIWSGPITLTADSGIRVQRTSTFNITGTISGAFLCEFAAGDPIGGGCTLNVIPAGGPNSYAATKISGNATGAIVAGNALAFSTGPLDVASGVLKLNGNSFTFANLTGAGGKIGNYHATTPAVLTVGTDGTSTTCASALENGGAAPLALVKTGAGTLTLTGISTYTGNTTINGGTLELADNARLRFAIGTISGACNTLTGTAATLAGDFAIDTTTAAALTTGTWVLENVASLTGAYGPTFQVVNPDGTAWTDAGNDKWTLTVGTNAWSFDETTGTLTLTQSAYNPWAEQITDPAQRGRTMDPDGDGFTNLQEFLFGTSPVAATGALTTTAVSGGKLIVRWKQRVSGVTYRLMTSATLANPWLESTAPVADDGAPTGDYLPRKAEVTIGTGREFLRVEGVEN